MNTQVDFVYTVPVSSNQVITIWTLMIITLVILFSTEIFDTDFDPPLLLPGRYIYCVGKKKNLAHDHWVFYDIHLHGKSWRIVTTT